MDEGVTENLYDVDQLRSTMTIYDIWNRLDNSIIWKFWLQTGLISEDPVEYDSFDCQDTMQSNSSYSSEITLESYFPDEDDCCEEDQ